jgi:hypothetical protein
VIVGRSSSLEVCHVHSRSLEASRSRVGIAERDDICWFRCVFGASRKRPVRAKGEDHAARSREADYGAIGTTTEALQQDGADSESVDLREVCLPLCLLSLLGTA